MSCLHTINRSPRFAQLDSCSSLLLPGDAVLFIEDGTYYCSGPHKIPATMSGVELYALQEDMIARGTEATCVKEVTLANYSKFVELSCEFDKVIRWF